MDYNPGESTHFEAKLNDDDKTLIINTNIMNVGLAIPVQNVEENVPGTFTDKGLSFIITSIMGMQDIKISTYNGTNSVTINISNDSAHDTFFDGLTRY